MKVSKSEFCSLVEKAKNAEMIGFSSWTILTDSEWDFGDMKESKVQLLHFNYSGDSNHSNWNSFFSNRFNNIISGISKSKGLKNSIKHIGIVGCEMKRATAEGVLEKYKS